MVSGRSGLSAAHATGVAAHTAKLQVCLCMNVMLDSGYCCALLIGLSLITQELSLNTTPITLSY